jgi:hypothetical protein
VPQNNVREALINVRDVREEILYFEGEPRVRDEVHPPRRGGRTRTCGAMRCSAPRTTSSCALGVRRPGRARGRLPEEPARSSSRTSALILGSVEAGAFTGDQLQMIADFVDRRGGGC